MEYIRGVVVRIQTADRGSVGGVTKKNMNDECLQTGTSTTYELLIRLLQRVTDLLE